MLLALRDDADQFPAGGRALAEARFGVDWLLRMWDDSTRTLYFQVGIGDGNGESILGDHDFWRLPRQMTACPSARARPTSSSRSGRRSGRGHRARLSAPTSRAGSRPRLRSALRFSGLPTPPTPTAA